VHDEQQISIMGQSLRVTSFAFDGIPHQDDYSDEQVNDRVAGLDTLSASCIQFGTEADDHRDGTQEVAATQLS
jgi:hypothetical protein